MSRRIKVAAAQLGGVTNAMSIDNKASRKMVLDRMVALLNDAADRGCDLVVFPEFALIPVFVRFHVAQLEQFDHFYEQSMPSENTQRLFDTARERGIGFSLGYAELVEEEGRIRRFNTMILVDRSGDITLKYRKVHLPGSAAPVSDDPFQNLEKYYFEVGNLGFPVAEFNSCKIGICICNDRRWPETYRMLRLKGAELILLGYSSPVQNPREDQTPELRNFHNLLCMQSGAYQNSCFVVGAAKAGIEDGVELIAGSSIINPYGEILAIAKSSDDELIVADCDMAECEPGRKEEFNFNTTRRPELYGALVEPH